MRKMFLRFIIVVTLIISVEQSAYAWPIYSKPEFRGRIVDGETKQPIEGAVVVVLYQRREFGGPGGAITTPMDAKETLTDGKGEFYFPSYKALIGPLSRETEVSFIIFKPGYMSINRIEGINIPDERYFAIDKDMIGKDGEIKHVDHWDTQISWKGLMGVAELKKGERDPLTPTHYRSKELPLLYKVLNEDRRNHGYKGVIK